jgi:hypothetical protein
MSRRALVAVLRRSRIRMSEQDGIERRIVSCVIWYYLMKVVLIPNHLILKTAMCKQDVSV